MPKIFLSPSTQEYNEYYDGSGSEEYYMNLIADYMEPYLTASGIQYTRNDPSGDVNQSVAKSNQGTYDLHLALHSNAAGPANAGRQQGADVYYYATSAKGKSAAEIFASNLRDIYPYPDRVKTVANTTLAELRRTKAPAILIELAYHDNPEDAEWIKSNLRNIAYNLALSTAEYLGVPFTEPEQLREGVVSTGGGSLNIPQHTIRKRSRDRKSAERSVCHNNRRRRQLVRDTVQRNSRLCSAQIRQRGMKQCGVAVQVTPHYFPATKQSYISEGFAKM